MQRMTTITVSEELAKRLNVMKYGHRCKSIDSLLKKLIFNEEDKVEVAEDGNE